MKALKSTQAVAAVAGVITLFLTTPATLQAATTATSSVGISLVVPEKIQISKLQDLSLVYQPGADAEASTDYCVSQTSSGTYSMTLSGMGESGEFMLFDSQNNSVAYQVEVNVDGENQPAYAGETLAGLDNAVTGNNGCSGDNVSSGSVTVILTDSTLSAANAGNYTGTLTLVVAAE